MPLLNSVKMLLIPGTDPSELTAPFAFKANTSDASDVMLPVIVKWYSTCGVMENPYSIERCATTPQFIQSSWMSVSALYVCGGDGELDATPCFTENRVMF